MITVYVFSVVVGGGLLALSLLGDVFGGDVDADLDADIDGDVGAVSDGGDAATKLFSLRAVVYGLFGFGGSGLVLQLLAGTPPMLTAMVAAAMGVGCGALVSKVFGYLKRTEAGAIAGDRELVGLTGKVVLNIAEDDVGAVRIRSGARRYRLRATADLQSGAGKVLEAGSSIVVVDVRNGVALVTPTEEKLLKD